MICGFHGNRVVDAKIKHLPDFAVPIVDEVHLKSPFQTCTHFCNLIDEEVGPYCIQMGGQDLKKPDRPH